jgi:hypothetical protein
MNRPIDLVLAAALALAVPTIAAAQNASPPQSAQSSAAQPAAAQAAAAQAAARAPATLSRPTGRFGRTLGLPKDGKDLFIADEDYIRFPLPRRRGLCRRGRHEDQGDDR